MNCSNITSCLTRAVRFRSCLYVILFLAAIYGLPLLTLAESSAKVHSAIVSAGIPGGVIVIIDPADSDAAVQMAESGQFLVHCLFSAPAELEEARLNIAQSELSGKVTASMLNKGRLPFAGNTVNIIVPGKTSVAKKEVLRVLAPRGRAMSERKGKWRIDYTKEVPATIDDWTHNLYDGSNIAVSKDAEAGPPRHLQWTADPRYVRSHDANNSFQAMVSSSGRIFYIMDEGSRAFLSLPAHWVITCRDAFNGKVLWKRPLDQHMVPHLDWLKSDVANLAHRIVAQEDVVYATLGFNQPVTALDSRTGEKLWVSEETTDTEEIIFYDGIVYCVIRIDDTEDSKDPYRTLDPRYLKGTASETKRKIVAVDSKTGKLLWEYLPKNTVLPLSLTVGGKGLFIHDGDDIVSLDNKSSKEIWRTPAPFYSAMKVYAGVNMVLYDDVLVFACGTGRSRPRGEGKEPTTWINNITGLDAATGKKLWNVPHPQDGCFVTPDLMIADGLIWAGAIDWAHDPGSYVGYDPKTGKVARDMAKGSGRHMPHHRCYRNRGTDSYLFLGRTGIELFDVKTGKWDESYWARGTCRYGMMPANGMIYVPPNSCSCYAAATVRGFNAMTADTPDRKLPENIAEENRLRKGPEYSRKLSAKRAEALAEAWPTYRGSADRHAMAKTPMAEKLKLAWEVPFEGELTQAVISDNTVVVSAIEKHMVYGLDEQTGKSSWSFLAGGRVNSSPTLWNGKVYFGSRDGWVYCLWLDTGKLVWKYRAAPIERSIVARENIESAWPVDGSVLVLQQKGSDDARLYCIAGRSMFLDGGLRMLVLDAKTGTKINETVMTSKHSKSGEDVQKGHEWPPDLPAARPDVLSFSNGTIYMGIQPFDLDGNRKGGVFYSSRAPYKSDTRDPALTKKELSGSEHLFCTSGFLDDNNWHRSLWMYGDNSLGGCWGWPIAGFLSPSGSIMAMDDNNVYGYGRISPNEGEAHERHLFAMSKEPETYDAKELKEKNLVVRGPYLDKGKHRVPVAQWSKINFSQHVRALLVAPNVDAARPKLIFAVGAPVVISEVEAFDLYRKYKTQGSGSMAPLFEKEQAAEGKSGATLSVVSSADGAVLSEVELESPALFNGISAANGRLYISNKNGELVCFDTVK